MATKTKTPQKPHPDDVPDTPKDRTEQASFDKKFDGIQASLKGDVKVKETHVPARAKKRTRGGAAGTYDKTADNAYSPYATIAEQEQAGSAGSSVKTDAKEQKFQQKIGEQLDQPEGNPPEDNQVENDEQDQSGDKKKKKSRLSFGGSRKKKLAFLAAVVGIFGTIGATATIAFLPFWASSTIQTRLQEAFRSGIDHAVDETFEKIVSRWMQDQLPKYEACKKNYTDITCVEPGKGPLATLYGRWQKGRVDLRLEERGLRLVREGDKINVFKYGTLTEKWELAETFDRKRRPIFNNVYNEFVDATELRGTFNRRDVRSTFRAYGSVWCLSLCKNRDILDDTITSRVKRWRIRVAARVTSVSTGTISTLFVCAISGCNDDDINRTTDYERFRESQRIDNEAMKRLADIVGDLNSARGSKKVVEYYTEKVFDAMFKKLGVKAAGSTVTRAIPVAGWIYLGIELTVYADYLVEMLENETLSKYIFKRNISEALAFSSSYKIIPEEAKSSESSLADKAALLQLQQDFLTSRVSQATSGISPKSTIECPYPTKIDWYANSLQDWGAQRVPDTSAPRPVLSGDSSPFACPNLSIYPQSSVQSIENFFNSDDSVIKLLLAQISLGKCVFDVGGILAALGEKCEGSGLQLRSILRGVVSGVNTATGWLVESVTDPVAWALKQIPGVESFTELVKPFFSKIVEYAKPLAQNLQDTFVALLFETPIDSLATGSAAFDQLAAAEQAGAYVIGKGEVDMDSYEADGTGYPEGGIQSVDATVSGMRGQILDTDQQIALRDAVEDHRKNERENQSLFARYFDISNHRSLASSVLLRYATSIPFFGPQTLSFNPVSSLGDATRTLGLTQSVFAQEATAGIGLPDNLAELFNIPQYGFPVDILDSDLIDNLIALPTVDEYNEACDKIRLDYSESWEKVEFLPGLSIEAATKPDVCQLIDMVAEAASKSFDLDSAADVAAYQQRYLQASPGVQVEIFGGGGRSFGTVGAVGLSAAEIARQELATYGGQSEGGRTMCGRIQEYAQVSINYGGTWNCTAPRGSGPWSGIFISFLFRRADAGDSFVYSGAHWQYINDSIKNKTSGQTSGFIGHKRTEHAPNIGDLVCYGRNGAGVTYDNAVSEGAYESHCDIVIEKTNNPNGNNSITVVGGNVSNTVGTKTYSLSAGGFITDSKVFVVIQSPSGGVGGSELPGTSIAGTGIPEGTTLTAYEQNGTLNGPSDLTKEITISRGEQIIGKRIYGCLNVVGPDVVIKNSLILCQRSRDIENSSRAYDGAINSRSTGLVVERSELYCPPLADDPEVKRTAPCDFGIDGSNFIARNNNIHGGVDGIAPNQNAQIIGNYIHGLVIVPEEWRDDTSHADAIQVYVPSANNILIQNNTFRGSESAADDLGSGQQAIFAGTGSNIRIIGNTMTGRWGSFRIACSQAGRCTQITGNKIDARYKNGIGKAIWQPGGGNISGNSFTDGTPVTSTHICTRSSPC